MSMTASLVNQMSHHHFLTTEPHVISKQFIHSNNNTNNNNTTTCPPLEHHKRIKIKQQTQQQQKHSLPFVGRDKSCNLSSSPPLVKAGSSSPILASPLSLSSSSSSTTSSSATSPSTTTTTTSPTRKNELSIPIKVQLIRDHETQNYSQRLLSNKYAVCRATVNQIIKQKDRYMSGLEQRQALAAGSKVRNNANCMSLKRLRATPITALNRELEQYVTSCRINNLALTGPILKAKAKEMALEMGVTNFKASNGWLDSFKKRCSLEFPKKVDRRYDQENRSDSSWDMQLGIQNCFENDDENNNSLLAENLMLSPHVSAADQTTAPEMHVDPLVTLLQAHEEMCEDRTSVGTALLDSHFASSTLSPNNTSSSSSHSTSLPALDFVTDTGPPSQLDMHFSDSESVRVPDFQDFDVDHHHTNTDPNDNCQTHTSSSSWELCFAEHDTEPTMVMKNTASPPASDVLTDHQQPQQHEEAEELQVQMHGLPNPVSDLALSETQRRQQQPQQQQSQLPENLVLPQQQHYNNNHHLYTSVSLSSQSEHVMHVPLTGSMIEQKPGLTAITAADMQQAVQFSPDQVRDRSNSTHTHPTHTHSLTHNIKNNSNNNNNSKHSTGGICNTIPLLDQDVKNCHLLMTVTPPPRPASNTNLIPSPSTSSPSSLSCILNDPASHIEVPAIADVRNAIDTLERFTLTKMPSLLSSILSIRQEVGNFVIHQQIHLQHQQQEQLCRQQQQQQQQQHQQQQQQQMQHHQQHQQHHSQNHLSNS